MLCKLPPLLPSAFTERYCGSSIVLRATAASLFSVWLKISQQILCQVDGCCSSTSASSTSSSSSATSSVSSSSCLLLVVAVMIDFTESDLLSRHVFANERRLQKSANKMHLMHYPLIIQHDLLRAISNDPWFS